MNIGNRQQKCTLTPTHLVSTVELPFEHWGGMWAETLVFPTDGPGGKVADWCEVDGQRYATYDEALAGHDDFVARHGGAFDKDGTEK